MTRANGTAEFASYQGVSLGQVYPGIEVKLKASNKNVEKIFYVSPQSDVADIKIGVVGVTGLEVAKDGRLLIINELGGLAMRSPTAWQEINGQRHEVKVNYRLLGKKQYGFKVSGDYNKNYDMVIDPELESLLASTFLGGRGYGGDTGTSLLLDSSGNVYLTGHTNSSDFPTTSGTFDGTFNQGYYSDVFLVKFNNDLTILLASTYLGGNNNDWGNSLALDSMGNVFLTGHTVSADFPITLGAFDQTKNGLSYDGDVFITKLNNNLTVLLASTYLGGNNGARSSAMALDNSDNVYLAGNTYSTDFPTTPGAFDVTTDRLHDIFISKLNNDLTMLLASTFLGWRLQDYEHNGNYVASLALDSFGNVYVTGQTDSADFPTTPGAYDRTYNGFGRFWADGMESGYYYDSDVFVAKLNGNLSTLMASTYLGWSDPSVAQTVFPNPYHETGYSLTLDSSGNIFVTGNTTSSGFPTTAGAYDQTYNEESFYGFGDAFVVKFNNELTALLASTFLGGVEVKMVRLWPWIVLVIFV
ncbi:MAG: SBBP repeat-containing protein [Candidatus Moduliflexus flocculans]|nr:SBBP repeat-containing protein [Candidatus Moduliflexus flocculans]